MAIFVYVIALKLMFLCNKQTQKSTQVVTGDWPACSGGLSPIFPFFALPLSPFSTSPLFVLPPGNKLLSVIHENGKDQTT